jgi:glycosyltransferase involved in cell wall biosynthesis
VVGAIAFAVPGDLATPTGGYAYDRRMIAELRLLGWDVDVRDLGTGFPRPSPTVRAGALKRLAAVPRGRAIVIDGLALGVLPEVEALRGDHPLVGLVHHPLALESGLDAADAQALRASERAALAAARHVVTTSASTARIVVRDYGVAADRVTVAPPGNDRVRFAEGSRNGTPALLAVGAIVPRKGYDVLLDALARLSDASSGGPPWRLTIAGDRGRDVGTAARLDAAIARHRLADRVSVLGAISAERLTELYVGADIFVLASRFEGYGMVYGEAIAHGLPIIGTTAGAIAETVPAQAGVLVPPDDVAALTAALRRLIVDTAERRRLAAGARAAALHLPTWRGSAALFARAIEAAT